MRGIWWYSTTEQSLTEIRNSEQKKAEKEAGKSKHHL
jgi:hypothetical protein